MTSALHIEITPATQDQQPVLDNLLQLYAHDFSEFHAVDIGPDGRFVYQPLALYWSDPNRHPFIVRVDGKLGGFVLVQRQDAVWDMAEFFIMRAYRRSGAGTAAAHQVWKRFPGRWQVRVMESNPATRFWQRALSSFTGAEACSSSFEKEGRHWRLFSFDSGCTRSM